MAETDVLFVCEHWLRPHELPHVKDSLRNMKVWTDLVSNMDPDAGAQPGRPYGGLGFICRLKGSETTYRSLHLPSERILGIEIICNKKAVLTIFGVYLPYFNGHLNRLPYTAAPWMSFKVTLTHAALH
jgi:hypothetical protein